MTSLFGKSQQVNQRTRPTSHESVYFLSSRKAITRGSDPGSIKDGCSLNTSISYSPSLGYNRHRIDRRTRRGGDVCHLGRELRVESKANDGSQYQQKKAQAKLSSATNQIRIHENDTNGIRTLCAEVMVYASHDDVWKVLTDFSRWHEYMPDLVRLIPSSTRFFLPSC
eukprot:1178322-Prorocentrum_minimum.AAC.3